MKVFADDKRCISMRHILLIALAAILVFAGLQTKTFAASTGARDAYINAFAQGKIYTEGTVPFAYFDIDQDGSDELITYPGIGAYSYGVYTYYNGKLKSLVDMSQSYANIALYPRKRVIAFEGCGHMGTYYDVYYQVSKGKATAVAEKVWSETADGEPYDVSYNVKSKKVSKAAYSSYIKSLKQGTKTAHKGLSWNYFVGETPDAGNAKYYDFYGAKKTTTYYVAFKPKKSGTTYFQMGIRKSPNYTTKATVTLCDGTKKAISKPRTVTNTGSSAYKKLSYKVVKNKTYNLKITTYNRRQSTANYYSYFELIHSANPL